MREVIEVRTQGRKSGQQVRVIEEAVQRAVRAETTLGNARAYVDIARSLGVRHWVLDELERILDGPVAEEKQSPCHFVTSHGKHRDHATFDKGDKSDE